MDRTLRLYPKVDEAETPLPRAWNAKDKYTYIGLSQSNLKVHYKGKEKNSTHTCTSFSRCVYCRIGSGKNHKDAASVRAVHPIPAACGVYYFEIKVISKGRDGWEIITHTHTHILMNLVQTHSTSSRVTFFQYLLCVYLCGQVHGHRSQLQWSQPKQTSRMGEELIWLPCRWWLCVQLLWNWSAVWPHLHHRRCGRLWIQLSRENNLLHKKWNLARNCCIRRASESVIHSLSLSLTPLLSHTRTYTLQSSQILYPTVGLQTPGELVEANFGETPFVFDFEGMLAVSYHDNCQFCRCQQIYLPPPNPTIPRTCSSRYVTL